MYQNIKSLQKEVLIESFLLFLYKNKVKKTSNFKKIVFCYFALLI